MAEVFVKPPRPCGRSYVVFAPNRQSITHNPQPRRTCVALQVSGLNLQVSAFPRRLRVAPQVSGLTPQVSAFPRRVGFSSPYFHIKPTSRVAFQYRGKNFVGAEAMRHSQPRYR